MEPNFRKPCRVNQFQFQSNFTESHILRLLGAKFLALKTCPVICKQVYYSKIKCANSINFSFKWNQYILTKIWRVNQCQFHRRVFFKTICILRQLVNTTNQNENRKLMQFLNSEYSNPILMSPFFLWVKCCNWWPPYCTMQLLHGAQRSK